MSSSAVKLSRSAIKLLLDCLESSRPLLSATALQRHPDEASQLKLARLIKPAGHEPMAPATVDDLDAPVSLTWAPDQGGYGYFSQARGWISVPEEALIVWTVDVAALIATVTAKLGLPKTPPTMIVEDCLWDLGAGRIGRRPKRTPIMFARRLGDQRTFKAITAAIRDRPSPERRLVLTSSKLGMLAEPTSGYTMVAVEDVVPTEGNLELDGTVLALRLDYVPLPNPEKPIEVFAEGREVHFYGAIFHFTKGFRQREVVNLLYQRHLQGERWVSSAGIVDELEWDPKTRIRDIFKKSPAWGHLLTERHGMCGFCIPDL